MLQSRFPAPQPCSYRSPRAPCNTSRSRQVQRAPWLRAAPAAALPGDGGSTAGDAAAATAATAAAVQHQPAGDQPQTQQHQPQQRSKARRGKVGARREDYAFVIARADLSFQPPWRFEQGAPLPDLKLRDAGLTALDDRAAADGRRTAEATFTAQLPTGVWMLVVSGHASVSALPLRCEFCGEAYEVDVSAPFDAVVYLGQPPADVTGSGGLAANEMVFEADAPLCDLTPLVVDALLTQLPTVCLCGGRSCKQHEGKEVAWTSFTPAAPAAAASPFAKLLAGGGGGGEQQAPAANKRRRKKQ